MHGSNLLEIDPDLNYFQNSNLENNSTYNTIQSFNDLCRDKSFSTIFHQNIRSFSANSDLMFSLFDSILNFPEIFVLSETWFKIDNMQNIPNYLSYHTIRDTRRSGGISVFIDQRFLSHKLENVSFCSSN